MRTALAALIVEDVAEDAELLALQLRRDGFEPSWKRVSSSEEFIAALAERPWDVVLSDYTMPRFNAREALRLLHEQELDVPFIIISGSASETIAVRAMKAGAHDFFSKNNLTRLSSAIERELQEARFRKDRREAVQELRRIEERYRLIVESVKDYAIMMLDAEGKVASWNRGAERVLGYTEAEIIGSPHDVFFTPDDRASGRPSTALRLALIGGLIDEEAWRVRKDGSRFWAESSLNVIRDDGVLRGYVKVIRDIGERKLLLDDLRQAVRARDEFLSIASHELKTPLTSLQLQVQSLQRLSQRDAQLTLASGKVAEKLGLVARQTERLTTLIDNMLDVTRITSGKMLLHRESTDLAEVVGDVMDRSRDAIRASKSEVHVQTERVVGQWDRMRVDAVVANLLSNALKYGEGRPIEVAVTRVHSSARLTVADHGIGISQEEQARIFKRFERAVPDRHYGGFGIGLWIVGQVVEAHGGSVVVASNKGEGSTFTVELPLAPAGAA